MVREIIGCRQIIFSLACSLAVPAMACEMPDEGNMPLRRAASRVERLPEVEAWARAAEKAGIKAQFVVRLDEPVYLAGREAVNCYWPVEVRGDGKLWRRYLITPDGKDLRSHD